MHNTHTLLGVPNRKQGGSQNCEGQASPNKLIARFDPTPEQALITKFNFFYKPYNPEILRQKHMDFGDMSTAQFKARVQNFIRADQSMS